MQVEEICRAISLGDYSAELDKDVLRIRNSELGSEYILEPFGMSVQIRQAVWFDCDGLPEEELNRIYALCSTMNERFSGCKCYIDEWGALVTAADILGPVTAIDIVKTMLNQIEFISQAMLNLVNILHTERRRVTVEEIDSALNMPHLH